MNLLEQQITDLEARLSVLIARQNYWMFRSDSHYQKARSQTKSVRSELQLLKDERNPFSTLIWEGA
ncbi:hypothetical protein [Dongshaea marina]|uniref:hypothetical protein n=1 Tax=Dongshaea marina TaxID=2047966 RepID=UPI000D3EAE58|nr:hypothetical protein [Dongshaea marina]